MASVYKYKATDESGMVYRGTIEADDRTAAIVALKTKYPIINSITNMGEKGKGLSMELGGGKIKDEEIALMCSQFAIILNSGAQIIACATLIANQTTNKSLKEILDGVVLDVSSGKSLSAAFEKHGKKKLPVIFYETVRAGEESGNLSKAFNTLKDYFEKASGTSKSIKSALTYPLFVIVVAIVVVIVIMIKVVPTLTATFSDMGGEVPGITKFLMAASDFFVTKWPILLVAAIVLVIAYFVTMATETGRLALDGFKLKSPLMGKMRRMDYASHFATVLGMLVSSGLPMTRAIEILARTFENYAYRKAVESVQFDVENGKTLGTSMRKHPEFPGTLTEMIATGEETGNLDDVLKTTGEYYINEASSAAKSFVAKLEPTMLVIVAAFAGFIVIAIYLPMFKMYDMF